jgi:hypothetical protein
MNKSEVKVAVEMMAELHGGGYLLGDGEYDASSVYDAAGAAGYQLLAPREHPEAGLGHHYQSPYRLRCIELMRSSFGQAIFRLRGDIERRYGVLTSFGGGLSPLPAWVRHENRVWMWAVAKLVINAVRIVILYAVISEASSNRWNFSVISDSRLSAWVVESPSMTSLMAA